MKVTIAFVLALAATVAAAPNSVDPSKLAQQRSELAAKIYRHWADAPFTRDHITTHEIHDWSVRWLEAALDVATDDRARAQAFADHVARMKHLQSRLHDKTVYQQDEIEEASYDRVEADLWAARGRMR